MAQAARRSLQGHRLDADELTRLVDLSQDDPHELLFWAWQVRLHRFGKGVRMCCIVPGKLGGCSENCKWCAQSAASGSRAQYASTEQVVQAAHAASSYQAASIGIVNSGRKPSEGELQAAIEAYLDIRLKLGPDIGMCASLGELTPDQADRLVQAGVTRYNHNLETSARFYPRMVSSHKYEDRLRTLQVARQAGLEICCGGLFGMGETWQDRIDLALTLRDEVQSAIVPLNFLHPLQGTPLESLQALKPFEILRIIAIFRLAMPDADLKIAGGREVNLRSIQSWMFYAGGTSIITGGYLTTQGQGADVDRQMIEDLGMEVVQDLRPRQQK